MRFVGYISGIGLLLAVSLLILFWLNGPKEMDGEEICQEFIRMHNAGDRSEADLLGRVPAVPEGFITEDEADRLDTDFFLRDSALKIVSVRREGAGRFVFVTKGYVSAPKYPHVHYKAGIDGHWQRVRLDTPDLHVEVRDGKIFGIKAERHQN